MPGKWSIDAIDYFQGSFDWSILTHCIHRDIKDLNAKQAKTSAETAKDVANDKTLKTKNEKDRRLREKRQNNVKRFMEEKKVRNVMKSISKS